MAYTFNPGVYSPGFAGTPKFISFPQPVIDCTVASVFEGQDHTIPLKAGGEAFGYREMPVRISIAGEVSKDPDGSMTSSLDQEAWEEAMLTQLLAIKDRIRAQSDTNPLELFLIYDNVGSDTDYLKYKKVRCTGFDYNMGEPYHNFYSYTGTFVAFDTTEYTTAPGS